MGKFIKQYHRTEEIVNWVSHGICFLLSIAGFIWMLDITIEQGGVWRMAASIIYGIGLMLMFLSSTLYHMFKQTRFEYLFQVIDHSAIYIMIAGSYTPYALISLGAEKGWYLFYAMWGVTIAGILFKIFFTGRFDVLSTILYVVMGWTGMIVFRSLFDTLPPWGVYWLVIGALSYCVGLIFYFWERLPYNHAVWHFFVIGGSVAHFISISLFVLPSVCAHC